MRVVKEAEERKNEILDAAEELFAAKGYEHTSTGDILGRVGIARGTLYYHFKSKEDILDALIERINGVLIAGAKKAAADQRIPVVERIIRTIMSMKVDSGEDTIGHEVISRFTNRRMPSCTRRCSRVCWTEWSRCLLVL